MRKIVLILAAIGAVTATGVATASARDYPYCVKGRDYPPGTGQCSFPTYAACESFASGQFAYCDINPFYQGNQNSQPGQSRNSRRNSYRGSY